MPFVNIRIVKEVIASDPAGKKARIADRLSAVIAEETGLAPDEVWIVFEEVNARDWFLGRTDVETRRYRVGA
jgi:4-oxalocrotonate tautomerase